MGHQKVLNFLNEASDSRFVTRKWNIFYDVANEIIYSIELLKYNLRDYNDASILVTGDITIIEHAAT